VDLQAKKIFSWILAVAVAAALIGCAAAPPAQQDEPVKQIRWRSIFTVQSNAEVGWHQERG
jgi:hypothetical protein